MCWVQHFDIETRDNTDCGNTRPHLLQRTPRSFLLHGSWWPQYIRMQMVLYLSDKFTRDTPSMESTITISWGSYKRLSRPKFQEIEERGQCSSTQFLVFNIYSWNVDHYHYSPDLAYSDYHLYRKITLGRGWASQWNLLL